MLAMLMIVPRPLGIIALAASWIVTSIARTLTAKVRSQSAGSISSSGAIFKMPALLTRISMPPSSSMALRDHLDGRLGVGEIDAVDLRAQRLACGCQPLDVDVYQGKLGAFAVECGRDLGTDSTGCTGDQCPPSGETTLVCPHGVGV